MGVVMNYGAAPTYVKIANRTLTGTASSVTFSNIPQGYTDLVLVVNAISTGTSQPDVYMRVNGSSTTYSRTRMGGNGSSTFASNITSETFWVLGPMENTAITNMVCNLMNYSSSSTFKTMLVRSNDSAIAVQAMVSLWRDTTPITSILLYPEPAKGDFATGSTFTIYGIKAAFVPKATGGDRIVQDGTYWYHTFLSSGTFTPSSSLTNVDYLVIAGGGGGSGNFVPNGYGGAGAGGLRSTVTTTGGGGSLESQITLSANSQYTVTVGAGGVGTSHPGAAGSNSSFAGSGITTITSVGGGPRNTAGGSGGGGSYDPNTFGAGTTGQGYRGGNGFIVGGGDTMGGGGGGAGAVGANATSTAGGAGGAGVLLTAFSVPTSTGASGYYAGGGAGAAEAQGRTAGSGGAGGGGSGGVWYSSGMNAVVNTGSGGGSAGAGYGGKGASGLVIVRYPI
jgi:hypothetical protein